MTKEKGKGRFAVFSRDRDGNFTAESVWLLLFLFASPMWVVFSGSIRQLFPLEWHENIRLVSLVLCIGIGCWGLFAAKRGGLFAAKLMAMQMWLKKTHEENERERTKRKRNNQKS